MNRYSEAANSFIASVLVFWFCLRDKEWGEVKEGEVGFRMSGLGLPFWQDRPWELSQHQASQGQPAAAACLGQRGGGYPRP